MPRVPAKILDALYSAWIAAKHSKDPAICGAEDLEGLRLYMSTWVGGPLGEVIQWVEGTRSVQSVNTWSTRKSLLTSKENKVESEPCETSEIPSASGDSSLTKE